MREHERKAIEVAVCRILDKRNWRMAPGQMARLPGEAVKNAEICAPYVYGKALKTEGRKYATRLVKTAKRDIKLL